MVTSCPRLRAPCSARKGNRPLPAMRPILLMPEEEQSIRWPRPSLRAVLGRGLESTMADNSRGSYVVLLDEASGTAVAWKLEFLDFSRRGNAPFFTRCPAA